MVQIPKQNLVKQALDEGEIEQIRNRLGYANIGDECIRKHQYQLRLAKTGTISRRIQRLFNFGNMMEDPFVEDLERIGITISRRQEKIEGFAGHWRGRIDGVGIGVPGAEKTEHLLEFKTHNQKNFRVLLKHESVKIAFPRHYAQCMIYMGKLGLTRTLYLGYNKNDSEYYIERIKFDEECYLELEHKEKEVLFAEGLYDRIGPNKPTWYVCKMCDFHSVCFKEEEPNRNCRTCEHVVLATDGWLCGKHQTHLDFEAQKQGCGHYQIEEILK